MGCQRKSRCYTGSCGNSHANNVWGDANPFGQADRSAHEQLTACNRSALLNAGGHHARRTLGILYQTVECHHHKEDQNPEDRNTNREPRAVGIVRDLRQPARGGRCRPAAGPRPPAKRAQDKQGIVDKRPEQTEDVDTPGFETHTDLARSSDQDREEARQELAIEPIRIQERPRFTV